MKNLKFKIIHTERMYQFSKEMEITKTKEEHQNHLGLVSEEKVKKTYFETNFCC